MEPQVTVTPTLKTALNNLRGKHIKSMLLRLERIDAASPDVRKIVLDELNDLMRDVLKELGYEADT